MFKGIDRAAVAKMASFAGEPGSVTCFVKEFFTAVGFMTSVWA